MSTVPSSRRSRRWAFAALASLMAVVIPAASAEAHIPVVLTNANTIASVATSPYVPDGTISFAFYGWLDRLGDTRVARIHLDAGQTFNTQLLIPDLAPENALPRWKQPLLAIVDPRGRVQLLRNNLRTPFHEEFTNTDYVILSETARPAVTGVYTLVVIGLAPERFVAVSGSIEQFRAALENGQIASLADVQYWYATLAGSEAPPGSI
jgi:hypothetical protein